MKNPFVIFQMLPVFDIDLTALTTQYRALVTNHHPDKGGDAVTMENINKAYSMLKNPIKRARALVELHGIEIKDEETLTDPMILDEIFELRMSGTKDLIYQRQQEALIKFKEIIASSNVTNMQRAYWRLLYLNKLI